MMAGCCVGFRVLLSLSCANVLIATTPFLFATATQYFQKREISNQHATSRRQTAVARRFDCHHCPTPNRLGSDSPTTRA